ncbi:hypothetical protein [uncultured Fusobacterium sp.]|uniref:hypothetical protein n=1 Tax=uncultured Fusobacterium sp. TaxID=159267 RepID=UPI0015A61AC9|nr:hypothetical protein [uncultured Fusobacterium sp.]
MAIVKTKIKEKNYIQIQKTGIEDNRLSWAATGLLTFLIGKPENWNIIMEHLKKVKTNGRDSTRSALNNLREYDYCHYFEIREKGKIVETIYLIFEKPTPFEEAIKEIEVCEGQKVFYKKYVQPETENPVSAKPFPEKQPLLIIDSNNNRLNNNRTTTNTSLIEKSREKNSSSYEFLDFKYFSLLNSKTKVNIKKNIKNLSKEKFEELYKLVEIKLNNGEIKNFNAFLYKALVENWNITLDLKKIEKELDEEKKKWLNRYSGVMSDPILKEEIENIIYDIPLEVLEKNKSKLGTLSLFEFKQHLHFLKKQNVLS